MKANLYQTNRTASEFYQKFILTDRLKNITVGILLRARNKDSEACGLIIFIMKETFAMKKDTGSEEFGTKTVVFIKATGEMVCMTVME